MDVAGQKDALAPKMRRLQDAGIRVSLFINPDAAQIHAAAALNAPVIELHTGSYAEDPSEDALMRLRDGADLAGSLGIELHAGHGLTTTNVGAIARLPGLKELNIGHFIMCEAIFIGLGQAVTDMRHAIEKGKGESGHDRR